MKKIKWKTLSVDEKTRNKLKILKMKMKAQNINEVIKALLSKKIHFVAYTKIKSKKQFGKLY